MLRLPKRLFNYLYFTLYIKMFGGQGIMAPLARGLQLNAGES